MNGETLGALSLHRNCHKQWGLLYKERLHRCGDLWGKKRNSKEFMLLIKIKVVYLNTDFGIPIVCIFLKIQITNKSKFFCNSTKNVFSTNSFSTNLICSTAKEKSQLSMKHQKYSELKKTRRTSAR